MANDVDPLSEGHDRYGSPGGEVALRAEVVEALAGEGGFCASGTPGDGLGED